MADNKNSYARHDRQALAQMAANLPAASDATDDTVDIPGSRVEFEEAILPIADIINRHIAIKRRQMTASGDTAARPDRQIPFIIGLVGSVAAGKSTLAELLRHALHRATGKPQIALVPSDGFLFPNAELEARGLLERKGFPESFDTEKLIGFLKQLQQGRQRVEAPIYSHFYYDIMPDQTMTITAPDIIILEGVNLLQPGNSELGENPADFIDFAIYIDADEEDIKGWFTDRFLILCDEARSTPDTFLHRFAALNEEQLRDVAQFVWSTINGKNLAEHIQPTKALADLIIHKASDHRINYIELRR